jgi:hypothetical protein
MQLILKRLESTVSQLEKVTSFTNDNASRNSTKILIDIDNVRYLTLRSVYYVNQCLDEYFSKILSKEPVSAQSARCKASSESSG